MHQGDHGLLSLLMDPTEINGKSWERSDIDKFR